MLDVKQRIDLYLPRFKPAQLSAEIKKLFLSVVIVFGVMIVSIAILLLMRSSLDSNLLESKRKGVELTDALARAISQIPNVTADANLVHRIAREKIVIRKKKQVIEYLYKDTISERENFTGLVDQLAQQSVKGIWLDKFEVLNRGQDIQLYGYAKAPRQVSKYIEMLGTQEAYAGRNFQQIHIKKSNQGWNEFYISTLTAEDVILLKNPERGEDR